MSRLFVLAVLLIAAPAAVVAHHGWGSYDASKPVTVNGTIQSVKYENPHALISVKAPDKTWDVVLAPVARMQARGASSELVAVGKTVSAVGYASRVEANELRAERITIDGKTVELR
jgi:hypothetical protein